MRRFLLSWLCVITITGHSDALSAEPSEAVLTLTVDGEASDWVLDEKSGRVFAAFLDQASVVEFDPSSGKEVRRFEVGGQTRQMVIKGDRLVVGSAEGPSLYVVDLGSNQVEGHVALEGDGPSAMFCTGAANPYAYAVCYIPDRRMGSPYVFQVDVQERKIRDRYRAQGWGIGSLRTIIPSADGRLLLLSGAYSPSGAYLKEFDERAFTFVDLFRYHHTFGQMTAGPANRYWMLGDALFPIGLRIPSDTTEPVQEGYSGLRRFAGGPALIHPELDLVVSVMLNSILKFQSFSEAKDLASVPFRSDVPDRFARPARSAVADDPALQFDVARNRVFYAVGREAYIVDMSEIGLPDTPQVLMVLPSSVDVRIGDELKVPLAMSNEEITSETRFSLVEAPEGMRIEDGRIVWRPDAAQARRHTVTVTAEHGEARDTTSLTVSVGCPSRQLDTYPAEMSLDPTGKRVLVLGGTGGRRSSPPPESPPGVAVESRPPVTDLLLFDAEDLSLIAERTTDIEVEDVLLTESGAYALLAGSGVVRGLSLEDLSDVRESVGTGPSRLLVPAYRGHIAAVGQRDVVLLDEETLETVPVPGAAAMRNWFEDPFIRMMRGGTVKIVPLEGAFCLGPFVVDEDSGAPQLLWTGVEVPESSPTMGAEPQEEYWGCQLRHTVLVVNNERVSLVGPHCALARDYPVAVAIRASPAGSIGSRRSIMRLSMELHELVEGRSIYHAPLGDLVIDAPASSRGRLIPGTDHLTDMAGSRIAAFTQGFLVVADLPEDVIGGLREPLRFLPKTSALELKVGETPLVEIGARGGRGKRTYSIDEPIEGIDIDEETGDVAFDTEVVWDSYLERLRADDRFLSGRASREEFVDSARESYRLLMDRPTESFPIAVEVAFRVTDEESASDEMEATFLLLGPAQDVMDVISPPARQRISEALSALVPEADELAPPLRQEVAEASSSAASRLVEFFSRASAPGADQAAPSGTPSEAPGPPWASLDAIRGDVRAIQGRLAQLAEDVEELEGAGRELAALGEVVGRGAQQDEKLASQLASLTQRCEDLEEDLARVQDRAATQNHLLIVGLVILCAQFVAWVALFFLMRRRTLGFHSSQGPVATPEG